MTQIKDAICVEVNWALHKRINIAYSSLDTINDACKGISPLFPMLKFYSETIDF